MTSRVVVVGASLGGLRAAESLRAAGYADDLIVVGQETWLPYNRPPLSKEALRGGVDHGALAFRRRKAVDDVQWLLGETAIGVDIAERVLTLAGGRQLPWDGLVAATGLRPRRLPLPGPTLGRHVLRTLDDAVALREVLRPGARVVVLGAGFVGCEVAASAVGLGCDVVNVATDSEPMIRPLGPVVAAEVRRRLTERGLRFRLGHGVARLLGDEHVTGVVLSGPDGSPADTVAADVVVEAVGSACNVEWLTDNDLDLADGVLTDGTMRAIRRDGSAVDGVHVVGDIARFPNAAFGGVPRRVEHWSLPTDTGRRAGSMLAGHLGGAGYPDGAAALFSCVPSFWSDLFELRLQAFGMPGLADRIEIIEGSLDAGFVAGYYSGDQLSGVVSLDMTKEAMGYRAELAG